MASVPAYMRYWGKAKKDPHTEGADYHLLPYHCLDVAAVGFTLLSPDKPLTKNLAEFLELTPAQLQTLVTFFLALHDLGKFASAFQSLYKDQTGNLIKPVCRKVYDGHHNRHDQLGFFFWESLWRETTAKFHADSIHSGRDCIDSWEALLNIVFGHHGMPVNLAGGSSMKDFTELDNIKAADQFISELIVLWPEPLPIKQMADQSWLLRFKQVSWLLAGVAVLADWVGSNREVFRYKSDVVNLADYFKDALFKAERALIVSGLSSTPPVNPFTSIKNHYGFEPTPLQAWAEKIDIGNSPQLFILEDVTGAGKTEAALALTHRLMQTGVADGFYFGLPTMATSNAMFSRIAGHYQQMLGSKGQPASIVLAHGAREMNELFREAVLASDTNDYEYSNSDQTITAQCNQWLADSRKKALLAPVGVGTIDQALMAVLPRRHQSLRLIGLHRKVLIFDEVHAADEYMFELLESLLTLHLHQGGSAILLTATLPLKQRQRLVSAWQRAAGIGTETLSSSSFPLATRVSALSTVPVIEQPLSSRSDVMRQVKVRFIHNVLDCIEAIKKAIADGQCVVWIRNSVGDALEAFQLLQKQLPDSDSCLLFHSRFILQDRKDTETRVLATYGKQSTKQQRAGKVLIATQVFQESLDADADLMISDICPIDDLIQRMGRLHRHTRDLDGQYRPDIADKRQPPLLYVHAPAWQDEPAEEWLSKDFRNTQFVYRSPGRLWLGMRELSRTGLIRMPEDARRLIEAVYSDEAESEIPDALQKMDLDYIADGYSKSAQADSRRLRWEYGYSSESSKFWQEDRTDIGTRLSEFETVEVVLLKITEDGTLKPWIDAEAFSIQLSTLKLPKNKYADRLVPVPESYSTQLETLHKRFRQLVYMQCWVPELDSRFGYQSEAGFYELHMEVT